MLASKHELPLLLNTQGSLCNSIFLPVQAGAAQRNLARARKLIRRADAKANDLPLGPILMQAAQQPPRGARTLAAFVSTGLQSIFALPMDLPEALYSGSHFYVRPLVTLFQPVEHFRILTLSQRQVCLYEADRFEIEAAHVEAIPEKLGALLGSQAAAGSDREDRLVAFLHDVKQLLHSHLRNHTAPLVLAAQEWLSAFYRGVAGDHFLATRHISRNPDLLSPEELQAEAWEIVEPYFAARRARELSKYRELAGTGVTSSALDEILAHSGNGRVRALFLASGKSEPDKSGEDLLNAAAVSTLRNGGLVYEIPPSAMPVSSSIAALFRY
jgi:hypothetical protein